MLAHQLIRSWRSLPVVVGMLVAGGTLLACNSMPLVAPTGTAITLVATASTLPLHGSTDIVAVLVEGSLGGGTATGGGTTTAGTGAPVHNGTVVTFTTTLGRIEPAEAKTTAGRASVRLVADGRSGLATVTAFSGSATQTLEVVIGAAAVERVALSASPQALSGTGGTTTITARVEDVDGNGLTGVPVTFSASRGTLAQTSGVSDASGTVSVQLSTTQESVVTATAGSASGTVTVTIKPRTTVAIAAPLSAVVGVPATFTVTPGTGSIVTDVVVRFSDGGSQSLGAITGATQVARVFRTPGVATITVTATDSDGGTGTASAQVAVAPLQLSVTSSVTGSQTLTTGVIVTFTATPTAGAVIERYEWNLSDGRGTFVAGPTAAVAYSTVGQRLITVRAIPLGNGTAAEASMVINVN